jgi:hypothetical protein
MSVVEKYLINAALWCITTTEAVYKWFSLHFFCFAFWAIGSNTQNEDVYNYRKYQISARCKKIPIDTICEYLAAHNMFTCLNLLNMLNATSTNDSDNPYVIFKGKDSWIMVDLVNEKYWSKDDPKTCSVSFGELMRLLAKL